MDNQPTAFEHPSPDSGRRYPRYPVQLPISATVVEEDAPVVSLHDISLTGFYFTSARAYAVDIPIEMQVVLADQDYRIKALVQRSGAQDGLEAAHGTAVLFVRGGDIHPFLAAVAAHLHRWPHAEGAERAEAEGVASERG